jgi:hypothetical protein
MTELVLYTGNITVKRQDGAERTYVKATRARQFYRAVPDRAEDSTWPAERVVCHACNIVDSNGADWCVGIDGRCPRVLAETVFAKDTHS